MREIAIKTGIGKHARPRRQLTKNSAPKNAVDAAVWPEGNALYFELKRGPFQTDSLLTLGRARPLVILMTRADAPASAHATSMVAKMRIHFLLPRQ